MRRPLRSALYVPGTSPRAVDKARTLPVDAVILDLEDAVLPDRKAEARAAVAQALAAGGYGRRVRVVRINGLETPWGREDLEAVGAMAPDAVLVPKVGDADQLNAVRQALPDGVAVWAMLETARGVASAHAIAATPGIGALVVGTNDLAESLRCHADPGRDGLRTALQHCLLAARASGRVCLDGVHATLRDEAGLLAECAQGRDWGFDGKTAIHPAQIAIINRTFGPTAEDVALARRRVAAFEAAAADGGGVAVLDGRIVEALHVDSARRVLALSAAIDAAEGD